MLRFAFSVTLLALVALIGFATLHSRTPRYTVAAVKGAFSSEDIELVVRSRSEAMTEMSSRRDVYEVTVFGAAAAVRRSGFRDLEHGRDCTVAGRLALHWSANVRAILNCDLVRNDQAAIARMDRALAALR